MTNPGYNEDGTPKFKTADREAKAKKAERAERIEIERADNRWWKGRMFKAAQELLKKHGWL